jgi:hypothetical protein
VLSQGAAGLKVSREFGPDGTPGLGVQWVGTFSVAGEVPVMGLPPRALDGRPEGFALYLSDDAEGCRIDLALADSLNRRYAVTFDTQNRAGAGRCISGKLTEECVDEWHGACATMALASPWQPFQLRFRPVASSTEFKVTLRALTVFGPVRLMAPGLANSDSEGSPVC